MASTTRSSNGRSKQAGTRGAAAANRSANGRSRSGTRSANRSSRTAAKGRVTSATATIGSAAKKAKTPIVAGGAGIVGLATGTALGTLLRGSRRPRVLGVPMPRGDDMKAGAKKAVRAGRWLYDVETDLRLLSEHAERSRRQSPIEVLLSALTTRALPRRR